MPLPSGARRGGASPVGPGASGAVRGNGTPSGAGGGARRLRCVLGGGGGERDTERCERRARAGAAARSGSRGRCEGAEGGLPRLALRTQMPRRGCRTGR